MIQVFSQYVSPKRLVLFGGEALLIALSIFCAALVRFWSDLSSLQAYVEFPDFGLPLLTMVIVFQVCFYYNDLYDLNMQHGRRERIIDIARSIGSACSVLGLLYFLVPSLIVGRGVLFIAAALIGISAAGTRTALNRIWPATAMAQNILILGCGPMALKVAREFSRRRDLNVHIVALTWQDATPPPETAFGYPIFGPVGDIETFAAQRNVSRIVVAMENRRGMLPVRSLVKLRVTGVRVEDAHTALAALTGRIWLETVHPSLTFALQADFRLGRIIFGLSATRISEKGLKLA
jgi:FlaA1/EpsC-like NDP-sugar epimerase